MIGSDLLTHTRMQTAKTCLAKHHFAYTLGIRKQPSEALRLGGAVHLGLDILKTDGSREQATEAVRDNYKRLIAEKVDFTEQLLLESCKAQRLVWGWDWRWGSNKIRFVASEVPFNMPLVNPETGRSSRRFRLAGKIDGICELEDGRLALAEHKTTGESLEPDSTFWKRLRLDTQISLYILAARQAGYPVQTVLYDVIRKPGIRPKKAITKAEAKEYDAEPGSPETVGQYGNRLVADLTARPEFYFARMEIPRLESDLEEFQTELWSIQQNIAQDRRYRNSGACMSPYPCEYLDVCSNGTDLSVETPPGFDRLANVHPELEDTNAARTAANETTATATATGIDDRSSGNAIGPGVDAPNPEATTAAAGGQRG